MARAQAKQDWAFGEMEALMSECDKEFLISFKNICLGHQTDTAIKALRILKMFLFEILIVFYFGTCTGREICQNPLSSVDPTQIYLPIFADTIATARVLCDCRNILTMSPRRIPGL